MLDPIKVTSIIDIPFDCFVRRLTHLDLLSVLCPEVMDLVI